MSDRNDTATTPRRPAPAQAVPASVRRVGTGVLVSLTLVVAGAACVLAMFTVRDPLTVGLFGVLALLVIMALRVPVGAALASVGALGIWGIAGPSVAIDSLTTRPFIASASWSLSVLPMFILMSYMLSSSGATTRIYNAARAWMGWAPGGLALTTNFAGAGFAAVSGSSVTIAYALGRVGLPEMFRAGYHPRLALGTVMMSGTMGNLIPPSILLVVYAGIAEVPVGPALIAGLLPGILLVALYTILISTLAVRNPSLVGGRRRDVVAADRAAGQADLSRRRTLLEVLPVLAVIVIVVGGIYNGYFTATEAGAVGVVASAVIAFSYLGQDFPKKAWSALLQSAVSTAAIFFLLIGAQIFNRMLTLSGVARWLGEWVQNVTTESVVFIIVVGAVLLILGFFMESTSIILITVPLFLPALTSFDIDPIWFGVFAVLITEIGMVTPPLGLLAFAVHAIAQDPAVNLGRRIGLGEVFRSALMFLPAPLALAVILVAFPQITSLLGGG